MAPPDEDYRRRIHLIQRIAARYPKEYLRFCCSVAHLIEADKLPGHLRTLRDNLAHCIRHSSHRPLTLITPQWTNDEWMRNLWFDVFGPEPPPSDPYPVPRDAWGTTRWTPAMRTLAAHQPHPGCDLDEPITTWCRMHRCLRDELMADDVAGWPDVAPYRPEPAGYRDHLWLNTKEGTRRAMPGEEWHTGDTDVTARLDADDHDTWWTEAKRLQAIADEAAGILKIDSPDVVHLCPDQRLERGRAERGPAYVRSIRPDWRWWRRVPRHVQLALARQVAAQPDGVARWVIGHELARIARRQAPGRRRRQALVVAVYLATIVALNAVQVIFALTAWQAVPIVIPAVLGLLAWHSWLKRRDELACDALAASIGMPLTNEAAAWLDDNYGDRVPRRLRWLAAPFRERPSWPTRLDAIRRTTPSANQSLST